MGSNHIIQLGAALLFLACFEMEEREQDESSPLMRLATIKVPLAD